MRLKKKLKKFFENPFRLFSMLSLKGWFTWLPDKLFLQLQYRGLMDRWPDLENPKCFNEKLQWLKLYYRKPKHTVMVDKYLVRDYIAEKIGEEYLIPLLGVWDNADEIDFDQLPNQFVLKCNHGSGGVVICRDKSTFDTEAARKKLNAKLKQDFYRVTKEWAYKNVPRKIVAEAYIGDEDGNLSDYKLMCYDGKHRSTIVCSHRYAPCGLRVTYFDEDWKVMPFEYQYHYPSVKEGLPKPATHDKMVELAEILSAGEPHLRVDFYDVDGKIYFGELTFFSAGGLEKFTPEEWDYIQGDWIKLPEKSLAD